MIRAAATEDLDRIKAIAVAAGMFSAEEVGFFDEMFAGAQDGSLEGHAWLVAVDDQGAIIGAAQFAPEPFADRLWNLYFLAADPLAQGQGVGSALIDHVEHELRGRGDDIARVLIVETSSTDQYASTRAFYAAQGFDEEARIREFYGPGDDKVVFWKALTEAAPR